MATAGFDSTAAAKALKRRLTAIGGRPVKGERKVHLRVAIPDLRQLVADFRPEFAAADDAALADLVERLWAADTYDEMHVAVEIMRLRGAIVTGERIERWAGDLDHWAVTDDLATVVRAWAADDPATRFAVLEALAADEGVWKRRLGVLSTVLLSRRGLEIDRTLALIDRVIDDRHQTVISAISWALRAMVASAPDRVATYVEDRADDLPARVRLEVWNKLRTGRKDGRKTARGSRAEAIKARFDEARNAVADRRSTKAPRDKRRPSSGRRRRSR